MRTAPLRVEKEIRQRHRLSKFKGSLRGRRREHRGSKPWHGADGSALQPLRQPFGPCLSGRAAADAFALLHQRRRDEFSPRLKRAGDQRIYTASLTLSSSPNGSISSRTTSAIRRSRNL